MTGIYLITNMINGNRYVGQSKHIKQRFQSHKKPGSNSVISKALREYGVENFEFSVLEECTLDVIDLREIYWINALKPEYNVFRGCVRTENGHCMPDNIKKLLSDISKKQWADRSEEEKQEIINKRLIGPRKGHLVHPATREKLRQANIGKKQSEESKSKRSIAFSNKKNGGWVKNGSSCFKPVRCIETDVVYESVKAAAFAINARPTGVTSVLKGRWHTCRGFHFEYCSVETNRDECSGVGLR